MIAAGGAANALLLYRDTGDAWDIPMDYASRPPAQATLLACEAVVDGPRAIVRQTYQVGTSRLDQEVVLTAGSWKLDFVTTVDWQERGQMLRASFPLAVHAREATYDIQFGSIRRPTHTNTSWDVAKFEVCGQKWADVSQADYGIALLNDCQYGYGVQGNVLTLDLLRSPSYPNPTADVATHRFIYALYPHMGGPAAGEVVRAGYELNVPLTVSPVARHAGAQPTLASLFPVEAANVVIETVKQAEGGADIIVRLYEAQGMSARTWVHSALPIAQWQEWT